MSLYLSPPTLPNNSVHSFHYIITNFTMKRFLLCFSFLLFVCTGTFAQLPREEAPGIRLSDMGGMTAFPVVPAQASPGKETPVPASKYPRGFEQGADFMFLYEKDGPYAKFDRNAEVPDLRDAFSKHYRNADGSMMAVITAGPQHYQKDGLWHTIVNNIGYNTSGANPEYPMANLLNAYQTYYGGSAAAGTRFDFGTGALTFKNPKLVYLDENLQVVGSMPLTNYSDISFSKEEITYANIGTGVDLGIRQHAAGFTTSYVVNQPLGNIPAGARFVGIYESVDVPQNWTAVNNGGSGAYVNTAGEDFFRLTQIKIYEKNSPAATSAPGKIVLGADNMMFYFPLEWVNAPGRNYPIVLDPTGTYYPTVLNYWTGTVEEDAGCDFGTDNDSPENIRVGFDDGDFDNDYYQSYFKFDFTALPDNACIQSGYISVNQYNFNNARNDDNFLRFWYKYVDPSNADPVVQDCSTIYNNIQGTAQSYAHYDVWSNCGGTCNDYNENNGWKNLDGNVGPRVASLLAQNWAVFGFDNWDSHSDPVGDNNDEWLDFRGWASADRPQLVVYYETPFIQGSSANVSVNNVCPGTSVNLSVTGGTVGSAGTWNWYSGSCGGTFVGSTSAVLTITAPAATTTYYVRGQNICGTTACQSVTLNVLQLSVAATSINASVNPTCQGGTTTLAVVGGALGAGAQWVWYTNGCGITPAGTGSSINVSPTVTTIYYVRAEGTCNTTVCRQITVTVNTPSVGGSPAVSSPTACINTTVGVTLSGQNGAVLNWDMRFNGGPWNSIGNAGLTSITSPSLTAVGTYDFRANVQNAPCVAQLSNIATVTVVPATVPGTATPALSAICFNGNTTVALSGNTGAVIGWERQINGGGWVNIGQAGLGNIPTGVMNTVGTWEYRAIVQSAPCGSGTSAVATINVSATSVGGTASSTGTLLCNGANPTISLSGQTGNVLYWEQQINGGGFNNIGNAGATSFSAGALAPGTYSYRAVVENAPCPSVTSASVNITVSDFSVGGSAVPGVTQACQGGSTTITLSGQTGAVLNWEIQLNGGGWTNFGNAGASVISTGALPAGANEFRAVIQNGGCASVTSSIASIAVDPTSVAGTATPDFTSVCDGSTVTLTVTGNTGTVVDWERQFNGGGWVSLGTGGSPYTTAPLTPFGTYDFRASIQSGVCTSVYTATATVTVNQNDDPSFNYSSSVFCQGGPNASPTITLAGGTFSATPAGLAINPSNGIIDLSASAPGIYTITHTTAGICSASATQMVTVTASQNTSFSYGSLSYCLNAGTNPVPTVTTPGGTFTSQNPGLIFVNASTGEINLALSQPGSYFVQYSLGGSCPSSSVQTVILTAPGNSTFTYANNAYCVGGTNPVPTVAQFGGTFSASPFGLVFANTSTGAINLNTSTPGTYTVTYTSAGPCATTSTQSITINAAGDPFFFYSASSFCKDATNPVPFVSAPGGGFTSSPAGLIFTSPSTGEINLAASQPGNYVITYTVGGPCPATYTQNVLIIQNQNATFNYAQSSYCQYNANPTPTVMQIGGVFTSSPAGLVFANMFTGQIDLAASSGGTYTITYTVPGACIGVYTQTVTVTAGATATLSYPGTSFCTNGTNPVATVTPAGGTFTSAPVGLSINGTGTINLGASVAGGYTVSYTAPGLCGTTATASVIIVTSPQAFIQPINTLCTASPSVVMTASPAGGTWSGGAYINASGVFNPATSGAGSFPVNYTVSGSGGCNASATYNVVVNASPTVSITPAGPFCSNDSIQVLTASPLTGTWSGNPFVSVNGLFFPAEAGPGVFPVVYTVSNGGCTGSATASIQVLNSPTPTINPVGTLCSNGTPVGLTASVSGGTWSGGAYISPTGTFNPTLAAVGNNTVTYTVNSGTCTAQATTQVSVSGTPNVNIITPSPFCQSDASAFIVTNIPGGVFAGGTFINGAGLFNPSIATVGNNTVIYTITGNNGCVGSDTVNVVVNATPNATITYPGIICEGAAAFALTAATPGGNWGGGNYVNSGIFDPGVAGVGSHPVTYSITSGQGCSASASITVTIDPKPVAAFNAQPNGLNAYFTDLSLHADSWSWNFGDGSLEDINQHPTHHFPDNGTYVVRLIASNGCGSDTVIVNVMVNKSVGIAENGSAASFNVFPNPADQFIQITAEQMQSGEWMMNIYDISGKEIVKEIVFPASGTLNKTVDVYALTPGVYFINFKNKETVHTVKFVKM